MQNTSKIDRAVGTFMLLIGAASFFVNINTFLLSISNSVSGYYYYSAVYLIVKIFLSGLLSVFGAIMLVRGVIACISGVARGQVFTIILAINSAVLYFISIIFDTISFFGFAMSYSVFYEIMKLQIDLIFMALSILLMVFAIVSLKKRNAAAGPRVTVHNYMPPQQKICRTCGYRVDGMFCAKCGSRWTD